MPLRDLLHVLCTPGNAGISDSGDATCIEDLDSSAVIAFCRERSIGLVVVGPEADFMKRLCDKYDIPTAKYRTFTDPSAAKVYIQAQGVPIVVKADGLAAGKGVIVAMTMDEAFEAVDSMFVENVFGSAGCRVIVEEFLEGEEASFFALVDGVHTIPLGSAHHFKNN